MTGVAVARVRVAIGAGGPTVISACFVEVPADPPLTAVALMMATPWMTGTNQFTVAKPAAFVVAELLPIAKPFVKVALIHTVAPWTGTPFWDTKVFTATVWPPIARSGTVIATLNAPEGGGGGGGGPAGRTGTNELKWYIAGGAFTRPTQRRCRE